MGCISSFLDCILISKLFSFFPIGATILSEGQILITRSGTIGNVVMVPPHWQGLAITADIIILDSKSKAFAGFLYAWFSSAVGKKLLKRYSYGAVVQHIEVAHVNEMPIPLLPTDVINEIGESMIQVNKDRAKAYELLEEAKALVEDKLIV